MGDTPSVAYSAAKALHGADLDNPGDARNWGGQYQPDPSYGPNVWTDAAGFQLGDYPGAGTVYRHRTAYLADWAARMNLLRGSVGVGRTQPTAFALDGFALSGPAPDGAGTPSDGLFLGLTTLRDVTATATGTFGGPSGTYDLTVGYLADKDGGGRFALLRNGATILSWTNPTGATDLWATKTIAGEALAAGDTLALSGIRSAGDFVRIDWLEVTALAAGHPNFGAAVPGQYDVTIGSYSALPATPNEGNFLVTVTVTVTVTVEQSTTAGPDPLPGCHPGLRFRRKRAEARAGLEGRGRRRAHGRHHRVPGQRAEVHRHRRVDGRRRRSDDGRRPVHRDRRAGLDQRPDRLRVGGAHARRRRDHHGQLGGAERPHRACGVDPVRPSERSRPGEPVDPVLSRPRLG